MRQIYDEIYKTISTMITKVSKNLKPETQSMVQELESKIASANESGKEDDAAKKKASKAKENDIRKKRTKAKNRTMKTALKVIN